jgi:hypothetical protein
MGVPLLRVAMGKFRFGKFPTDEILDFGFWILDTIAKGEAVPTAGYRQRQRLRNAFGKV